MLSMLAGCAAQSGSLPAGLAPAGAIHDTHAAAAVQASGSTRMLGSSESAAQQIIGRPLHGGCERAAVFVRLDTQIRGYPANASGVTRPCATISGSQTQLDERGPIVISVHGYLHSMSFQANGTDGLTIHAPYANGNAAPTRIADVSQDHIALAVDSNLNDYIVASEGYAGDNCWYVVPDRQNGFSRENCDVGVSAIHALATNSRNELLVAGTDITSGRTRIDIFSAPASSSPVLVRTIAGPATGLSSVGGSSAYLGYFAISYSLATDPASGAIYVYDHLYNFLNSAPIAGAAPAKISEFAALANGDVAPLRVLSGPKVGLVDMAFGVNILGIDGTGKLFVLERGTVPLVAVFGADEQGDVAPQRTFSDPSGTIGSVGAALAVRI